MGVGDIATVFSRLIPGALPISRGENASLSTVAAAGFFASINSLAPHGNIQVPLELAHSFLAVL